jgi:hypothetical protein
MRVRNEDCSTVGINRCDTAPTPTHTEQWDQTRRIVVRRWPPIIHRLVCCGRARKREVLVVFEAP